jgi:hypothetical protein
LAVPTTAMADLDADELATIGRAVGSLERLAGVASA